MVGVYEEISTRLKSYSIDLGKYIYIDPKTKNTTLKIEKTTLDGISFIAQDPQKIDGLKSLGKGALEAAIISAKSGNGLRAFAGQISRGDLNNSQLQLSFLATEGKGFREIFYLPEQIVPARDFNHRILLNQDIRMYDLKFGKMIDSQDITSIHVAITQEGLTSVHLDKQGFIFADRNGNIYLSSNVKQHIFDELIYKDKFLGALGKGTIPTFLKRNTTIFFQLDHNSISDPTLGSVDMQNNQFLRYSSARAIIGLEASYGTNRLQLFSRGSLGLEISNDKQLDVLRKDYTGVVGLRGTFGSK